MTMEDIEMSDYRTIDTSVPVRRTETNRGHTEKSATGRILLHAGIITLGLLCVLQAALNISLRLTLHPAEEIDWLVFNSSEAERWCQIDQSWSQNSTRLCSCCEQLLRRLLRDYKALEADRARLQNELSQLNTDNVGEDDDFMGSGSGSLEEPIDLEWSYEYIEY